MASALVVYATITGNNEDVADIIVEALKKQGVDTEETEITMADPADFEDVDICVVCPYTYGEGTLPDEGLDFFDDLKEEKLDGKVFGVAGSGDKSYGEYYCKAVDSFDDAFAQTGATRGGGPVHINLNPDKDDINTLDKFAQELIDKANK